MSNQTVKVSKFMSLVLRHDPGRIGIELDENGWVSVEELLAGMAAHGRKVSLEQLQSVVRENDKQRFRFSEDKSRIRANQGHSVDVDLGCEKAVPPTELFHGTVGRFLKAIREQGLLKGSRHHVHLSAERETARKVGSRRGRPVVLSIDTKAMHESEIPFFVSDNGVWLTDHVDPEFIRFPD